MAARVGMATLIIELRSRCDAGTADYSSGGQTFWTDDQLQTILDSHRADVKRERLLMSADQIGGSAIYQDYYWGHEWVEEMGSGTAIWRVDDSSGSAVGTTLYTPEYRAKHLRFAANTLGTAYYLTYRVFDLDRAAADVWEQKAASVAMRFDVKTDNHDLKRSQLVQQYRDMAAQFRRRAGARVSMRLRDDSPGEEW